MQAVDLIKKKRDGASLSPDEIAWLGTAIVRGELPDYQTAAMLMAMFLRGLNTDETVALTRQMVASGETLDLNRFSQPKIDKHSTGGVGDKISLMLAPLVASHGILVPMVSGRGLGHTGGTLDKLEAIPGFSSSISTDRLYQILERVGFAIIGATKNFVPLDAKLYAMRDTTATVDSLPLITASIMSKKLAEGLDGLVLDVKTGGGAFMKRYDDAVALAKSMVALGQGYGVACTALVTDMNEPLGRFVGNALEVAEAIAFLQGDCAADLRELTLAQGAHMLVLAGKAKTLDEGTSMLTASLANGKGLELFARMIEAQGGNPNVCEDVTLLPRAAHEEVFSIPAPYPMFLAALDSEKIGRAGVLLGGGRAKMGDPIDYTTGFVFHKKCADLIQPGEPLLTIHYNDEHRLVAAKALLSEACVLAAEPPVRRASLIHTTITGA